MSNERRGHWHSTHPDFLDKVADSYGNQLGSQEPQVIAHEPEGPKPITDAEHGLSLAKVALGGVAVLAICDVVSNAYHLLHGCAIEDILFQALGYPEQTVVQCVNGTKAWLPFILERFK